MKKFLFLLAAFALFAQNANSKCVTVDQAKAIAMQQFANTTKFNASNVKMTLNYQAMNLKGQTDYYVFNREGGQGFVIVAGDDVSTPVLGYSDKGSFDLKTVPEPLRLMLDAYQQNLAYMRTNHADAPRLNYDLQPYGVAPILGDVHWWQGSPYNTYSPRASNMPQDCMGRCYTGCAATALAQIMKGLRHPYRGFGSNTYSFTLEGQEMTLTSNFADHIYKYSNMRTGYGPTSTQSGYMDVAQLFFDIDVALNMRFMGEDGSDAYIRDIIKAMIAYFDFNPGLQYLQKSSYAYNEDAWYDMMYNEIDNGRPIYYLGYRTIDNSGNPCNVGHAFVLDGYDRNGLVHVNWGFQPEAYNAYFDFEVLSPRLKDHNNPYQNDTIKEGFNANNAAIIGICPDTTDLGGVVVKKVNLVADTMPANDIRASIEVQALSGSWSGSLRYGIVAKTSSGYSTYYSFTKSDIDLESDGIVTIDLSGAYPYLYEGQTYYIVVWSPYFANSYDWNWFLNQPVPFTIGDWAVEPFDKGDLNHDGFVDVSDVTELINLVLNGGEFNAAGDMDENGALDVDDVTALIATVLG